MGDESTANEQASRSAGWTTRNPFRFHRPRIHLAGAFGSDGFGRNAEKFARYFGTPQFLLAQTIIVGVWILANALGLVGFDVYPFILLNLAFSLQAAYAAPLILLAQTRQADRDKAHMEADAEHREELAVISERRQDLIAEQNARLLALLEQNTHLTQSSNEMSQRIQALTQAVHKQLIERDKPAT